MRPDGRGQALFPKSRRRRRPDAAADRDRDGDLSRACSIRAIRWRSPGGPLIWPFSNPRFLLGTDNSGRDIAAQIFYGARISLLIGGVATAIAILIGILVGAFAGYYGGWVDNVLMRITEAFQTLPNFVLLLVLVAVFGSTLTTVTIAVGVVSWPAPARLTRAEFLSSAQPRIRPGRPDARHAGSSSSSSAKSCRMRCRRSSSMPAW